MEVEKGIGHAVSLKEEKDTEEDKEKRETESGCAQNSMYVVKSYIQYLTKSLIPYIW